MATEIKGKVKVIGEFQTFDSGFTKQQLVVSEEGQYPNDIPIDFLKDKTDLLQNLNEGDEVSVSVNIRGSEYQGKYYVGLNGWRIERNGEANPTPAPSTQTNPKEYPQSAMQNSFVDAPSSNFNEEEHDDLPF